MSEAYGDQNAAGPSRSSRLDRILNELVGQVPEIEAASVVSFDGLAMAAQLPAEMDEDRVAAMSAALLSLGERAAEGLGRGTLSQVYIEGENGTVFLISADDEAVLVAVAAKRAKVGLILFEVRRAAAAVAEALRVELAYDEPIEEAPAPAPLQVVAPPPPMTMSPRCRTSTRAGAEMKLEGSLDAFSLPDVFQLLSFTKKSGGLHLAHDGSDGVVFFAGGQISGASADSSRQPLARRLVGSGTLTDEALADAIQVALSGEGVGVVRALLDQGAVDAELLRVAAGDQSVDAVFDLLRWQNGDFAFVMDEGNPDDVGVSMSVEAVLADAEARRASWDSVSQVVPSPQAVLAMPVVLPADPQVSREEWSLLALVDGRRTVTELVDLTGSGQYAVVSTLAALVTRGLLEVRAEDDGGVRRPRHRGAAPPAAARAAGG